MTKKTWLLLAMAFLTAFAVVQSNVVFAQDGGAPAPAAADGSQPQAAQGQAVTFWQVVVGSGWAGVLLWVCLFGDLFACVWFIVDCSITVRPTKIMPQQLVDQVTQAIEQGDILKALSHCESEPGPLSSILTAGFSHVEEGFETIQEAVGVAANLESEQLMQRIAYLSVVGALAPMLGLLGTVQGMILAFDNLSRLGEAVIAVLANNIAQALWTTAAGLCIAVPAIFSFNFFRNKASRIILRMEAITLELIKDLRNVEVVEE